MVREEDEKRLGELGYRQEFARAMTSWSNIGLSVTVLSVPSAVLPYLYQGLSNGGPMGMMITWPIVSLCSLLVALAMAEIVSAYPTSGGLYYWSAQLAGRKHSAVVSYFTGWFNFLGLFGLTAGTAYAFGEIFVAAFYIAGTLNIDECPVDSFFYKFLVVVGGTLSLLLSAIMCMADTKGVALISLISLWINLIGTFLMTAGTAFIGDQPRTSLSELLASWNNSSGFTNGYAIVISLLGAATTYSGYDSVAHLAEETISVAVSGPVAIISSIVLTLPVGWFVLWGFLSAIPTHQYNYFSDNPYTSTTASDILVYTHGPALGLAQTINWAILNLTCVYGCLATWGRMGFAFARDGALPYSRYLYHLDKNRVPSRAMWVFAGLSVLIMIPALYSDTLYIAIDSMGTSASYVSYSIPILLRIYRNKTFPRGPFHLGWYGNVNAVLAILWLLFASIVLCLPTEKIDFSADYHLYIDTYLRTFNWSPILVLGITFFASCFWYFRVRYYFKGPKLDPLTLRNMEFQVRDLKGEDVYFEEKEDGDLSVSTLAATDEKK